MSDLWWAAFCLSSAAALICTLVFDHARHDPKPAPRVRLDDRRTWRREPDFIGKHWVHFLGAALVGAVVVVLMQTF
jgi:hypothetical protein